MSNRPILDDLVYDVNAYGLVGVDRQMKLIYLCNLTRLLMKPQSYITKGSSSAGKSKVVETALQLVPPEDIERFDAASATALFYSTAPLTQRIVYTPEANNLSQEVQGYLRVLLSEGRLDRIVTDIITKSTKRLLREGPCMVVQTVVTNINWENETRALLIDIPESSEQTSSVMVALARRHAGMTVALPLAKWRELDLSLPRTGASVAWPVMHVVATLTYAGAVRMRRDFEALLSIMEAHALLYAKDRERDGLGRIVADLRDYAVVRDLLLVVLATQTEAAVSEGVKAVVHAAIDVLTGRAAEARVNCDEIAEQTGLDKRAVRRYVAKAVAGGYLVDDRPPAHTKMPRQLSGGDALPTDKTVLPTVEAVAAALASMEGVDSRGHPEESSWIPDSSSVDTVDKGGSSSNGNGSYETTADPPPKSVDDPRVHVSTPHEAPVHGPIPSPSTSVPPRSFDDIAAELFRQAGEEA